jgi:hypothetical protein
MQSFQSRRVSRGAYVLGCPKDKLHIYPTNFVTWLLLTHIVEHVPNQLNSSPEATLSRSGQHIWRND